MRRPLLWLHKYAGLLLGLLLSITGLSGSLLVFDRELDEWLTPGIAGFAPAAELASFDLALANAEAAVDNGTQPTRIALGRDNAAPHIVRFPTPPGAAGPIEVSINPGTAEVTAVRTWGEYPVTWIYHLHMAFLGGDNGHLLVGVMGICLLLFCITGVIIWWPRKGRNPRNGRWKRALTVERKAGAFRLNLDLHKVVGIYFLPLLLMLALTGIELVWHEPVEQLVRALLPVQNNPIPQSTALRDGPNKAPVSIDRAAELALARFPQSRIARIYLPRGADEVLSVTLIHPDDNWREYSTTYVYVDRYDAKVLGIRDGRDLPAGNQVLDWLFPLHNGDALGIWGRWLVFVAGLLPSLLFGTGVYMWWRKRVVENRRIYVGNKTQENREQTRV